MPSSLLLTSNIILLFFLLFWRYKLSMRQEYLDRCHKYLDEREGIILQHRALLDKWRIKQDQVQNQLAGLIKNAEEAKKYVEEARTDYFNRMGAFSRN